MSFNRVVIGGSLGGMLLAAELARAGHRVALIDSPQPPDPRLIGGCSLRRGTLQGIAAALRLSFDTLLDELGAPGSAFHDLGVSMPRRDNDNTWILQHRMIRGCVYGREPELAPDTTLGLSVRHGFLLEIVRKHLPSQLVRITGRVDAAANPQWREQRRLVVEPAGAVELEPDAWVLNATPRPGLLRSVPEHTPTRWVVAVQAPLVAGSGSPPRELARLGLAPVVKSGGIRHVGFITPFHDPLSASAGWYGINTTVLTHTALHAMGKQNVIDGLQQVLVEWARAFGCEVLDPERTLASAVVPVAEHTALSWHRAHASDPRLLDLTAGWAVGAPAINVDGMLGQVVGARSVAQSLAHDDAESTAVYEALDRALAPLRGRNRYMRWLFFAAPWWWLSWNNLLGKVPGVVRAQVLDWQRLGSPPPAPVSVVETPLIAG